MDLETIPTYKLVIIHMSIMRLLILIIQRNSKLITIITSYAGKIIITSYAGKIYTITIQSENIICTYTKIQHTNIY